MFISFAVSDFYVHPNGVFFLGRKAHSLKKLRTQILSFQGRLQ